MINESLVSCTQFINFLEKVYKLLTSNLLATFLSMELCLVFVISNVKEPIIYTFSM